MNAEASRCSETASHLHVVLLHSVLHLLSEKLASVLNRFKKPKSPSQKQHKPAPAAASGLISSSTAGAASAESCSTSAPTGDLCTDPTILTYVKQLDDHQKKCELSGR